VHILKNWPNYFEERHEGLGTTYERFVLHRYFNRLKSLYSIESVIETPSFGMTGVSGINSMWWASKGNKVTVVDHDTERLAAISKVWEEVKLPVNRVSSPKDYGALPFNDKSFDMGWNFAALFFVRDIKPVLHELARVSKKVIFICVPNLHNILVAIRAKKNKAGNGIYGDNADRERIVRLMADVQWVEREHGTFDAPLWPDIAMNKEEMLKKVGLSCLANRLAKENGRRLCILDYFAGQDHGMKDNVLKYDVFEQLSECFKKHWAHHQYVLFTPENECG